tara:strand:+ start:608 stop:1594 length:987 start_codon:yes stop_codon:yes gene_type:complete
MKTKIKIAFIYNPSNQFLTGKHFDNNYYYFFMNALKRNSRINVTYFGEEEKFDGSNLGKNFDAVFLAGYVGGATPKEIVGMEKINIPVIAWSSDSHFYSEIDYMKYHKKYNISHYVGPIQEEYFYKFLPRDFKYERVFTGIEASRFQQISSFNTRIKDKILNSGAMGNKKLKSRIANRIINPKRSGWYFYKLRTLCNELPYVAYKGIKGTKYTNDYVKYLSSYRAAIAATTMYPSLKYCEVTAAGCLTFMEVTKLNKADLLGFEDNKSAIFINEKNYKEKFNEYLHNPDDSKWSKIANEGRNHVLSKLTNDNGITQLVDHIEKILNSR